MTGELLKSEFTRGRTNFAVTSLTGASQTIIGELPIHKAHVAVISEDLQDGPQAGYKVLQKLRDSDGTSAIMLMQCSKPDCVVTAFRKGARGIYYRDHSMKALSKCIRTVHSGQIWAGNKDIEHMVNALAHSAPLHLSNSEGLPLLTAREEEAVGLVADGLKNREIARRLNVTEHSVRNYLYRIFEKLGVSSRVELILYAFSRRNS
ncbi:MAG: response regulator transcription factor [Candidatus Acidiferrales bacterium]